MTKEQKLEALKEKAKFKILEIKKSLSSDWEETSKTSVLPEYLLEEFIEDLNWKTVCLHQPLSESFLRKFKREVDWTIVTKVQKMSESFIEEMEEYIDWYVLFYSRDLSESFINKHINRFSPWMENWWKKENGTGTLNSQPSWFDGSSEGAAQKQTLISNLVKAQEIMVWETDLEKLSEEELDELLLDEEGDQ